MCLVVTARAAVIVLLRLATDTKLHEHGMRGFQYCFRSDTPNLAFAHSIGASGLMARSLATALAVGANSSVVCRGFDPFIFPRIADHLHISQDKKKKSYE
jgi:hypothetical protein